MAKRLVFGCGYLGRRVAELWKRQGDEVFVVSRTHSKATQWDALGFRSIVQDVASNWTLSELPSVETVLFAIGFDRSGPHRIRDVYVGGFESALKRLNGLPRIVYISSTGVYGNTAKSRMSTVGMGEFPIQVDEEGRCAPSREAGRCCLAAEQRLLSSALGADAVILRSAGIYGPQRIPNLPSLRKGEPIHADPDSWLNLIHVDDLAEIVRRAANRTSGSAIINVSDGHPVLRRDYYGFLTERLQLPAASFVDEKVNDLGSSRLSDPDRHASGDAGNRPSAPDPSGSRARQRVSKWIDNRRLLAELFDQFQYPNYQVGLAASIDV